MLLFTSSERYRLVPTSWTVLPHARHALEDYSVWGEDAERELNKRRDQTSSDSASRLRGDRAPRAKAAERRARIAE